MNNRQRMKASNKKVREWLLENNYDQIWFKPHGKHNDYVFTQKGNYMAQDIWNMFDGICFDIAGNVVFLQMATNGWHTEKDFKKFAGRYNVNILLFNVTDKLKECNGKYKVFVRYYP